jgi:biotin carboxyl carrier protein
MHKKQNGFAHLALILILVVAIAVGGVGYYVMTKNKKDTSKDTKTDGNNSQQTTTESKAKIKHLGVNLDYYDPATNKAGDFLFTKAKFSSGIQLLFTDYGYVIKGQNTSTGQDKANPQPTFILPLGSKVYSLVDGEVYDVPKLYSNDYSVMVQAEGSDLIFETEHVINVKVKKGDKVKAGQVVAEVSDYSAHGYDGLGLVEIGILKGGNPPSHICPFDYLDSSIKDETVKKINALKKSWEEYRGDTSLYDESKEVTPGCLTSDPIEG